MKNEKNHFMGEKMYVCKTISGLPLNLSLKDIFTLLHCEVFKYVIAICYLYSGNLNGFKPHQNNLFNKVD